MKVIREGKRNIGQDTQIRMMGIEEESELDQSHSPHLGITHITNKLRLSNQMDREASDSELHLNLQSCLFNEHTPSRSILRQCVLSSLSLRSEILIESKIKREKEREHTNSPRHDWHGIAKETLTIWSTWTMAIKHICIELERKREVNSVRADVH